METHKFKKFYWFDYNVINNFRLIVLLLRIIGCLFIGQKIAGLTLHKADEKIGDETEFQGSRLHIDMIKYKKYGDNTRKI